MFLCFIIRLFDSINACFIIVDMNSWKNLYEHWATLSSLCPSSCTLLWFFEFIDDIMHDIACAVKVNW